MTGVTSHPRDPRHRRRDLHPVDPLAAAVRLEVGMDAMRSQALQRGSDEPSPEEWSATSRTLAEVAPALVPTFDAIAAAAQGATHEPRITAQEFADALRDDVPDGFYLDVAASDPLTPFRSPFLPPVEESTAPAPVGPSLSPTPPAPAPVAFDSERSTPPAAWRSRHDPRSLAYGIRSRLVGSAPLQDVLLTPGPVLDQVLAGASLREQSCCTGCGTVAAVNALRLVTYPSHGAPMLTLDDAESVYARAQQIDELPGESYAGTSVLAAMQAGVEAGLFAGYLWAFGTKDVAQTLLARRSPLVIGVPWLSGMWETGPGGLVRLDGDDEGLGHCLAVVGIKLRGPQGQAGPFFVWQNSAGVDYGDQGFGYIHHRDLAGLLHGIGEAAIPVDAPRGAA